MAMAQNSYAPSQTLSILTLLIALIGGPVAAQSQEDPDLHRLTLRHDLLGWEAVGRLDIAGKGYCTGTLLAPNLVLTAAHCLFDRSSGERVEPHEVTFRAGLRDGVAVAQKRGRRAVVHENYTPGNELTGFRVAHDVALLELDGPVSYSDADPFGVASMDWSNDLVSVVSFGRGRDEALSRQGDCHVIERFRQTMALDCSVTYGSSGSPVFQRQNGRLKIVSVVSAMGEYDGKKAAFSMQLEPVLEDVKAALRSGRGVWPAQSAGVVRRLTVGQGARPESGARFVKP